MIFLKESFQPRLYQQTIFSICTSQNTLVVLPTGLGKTAIAAMTAAHRIKQHPKSKIIFLAPTKPLVQQHLETFKSLFNLPEEKFVLFTGSVPPAKRVQLWEKAIFIFSTPQGMENDLISRKINLKDVSLLIFDEAHRTSGDYAYEYIAEEYHKQAQQERILALTASPGADKTRIEEVCESLFIEGIEVKSLENPEIKPYIQKLDINYISIELTEEILRIKKFLTTAYEQKLTEAQKLGYVVKGQKYTKTALLKLQGSLHGHIGQGDKSFELLKTISLLAESLKIQHALELCESQTITALLNYLESLEKLSLTSKTKAVKNLVMDTNFRSALLLTKKILEEGKEHPKLNKLKEIIIKENISKEKKCIIFTQFRDTAVAIKKKIQETTSAEIFVGQAKKKTTGLTQKQQKEMLNKFKKGEFSTLIATSVAEEGLDIPLVDKVIFYEPVPSAIRTVQRRGRTGRHSDGKVSVLISKGTRDEAYRWSAHHKEKRMYKALKEMKKTFTRITQKKEQQTLNNYTEELTITVDYREKGSPVMKSLLKEGVTLDLQQLTVGDYIINEDVIVEYKTVKDFVDSIIDGRLIKQLKELRTRFKPIIIIEGQEDIYSQRKITPAAIRGMLATIILSYHIPIIRTTTPQDTAGILISLAKKELKKEKRTFNSHINKPRNLQEQQEYIIASLPGIGPKLVQPLLKKFKTVIGVMQATTQELQEIELIGKKKAETIRKILDTNHSTNH